MAFVVGHAVPFGDRRGEAPLRALGVHRGCSRFSTTIDDRSLALYRLISLFSIEGKTPEPGGWRTGLSVRSNGASAHTTRLSQRIANCMIRRLNKDNPQARRN